MRLLLLCFILSQGIWAQQFTLVNKTALNVDRFIGFDAYQHLYYVHKGAVHKEGNLGKFVFQDFQLGPITSVDIINPLNVVVFYAEVNTVVFLDNRLNEIERINFNDLPALLNISLASNAGNNRLWVFNADSQELQLFHYRNMNETIVSQPIKGNLISMSSNFNECVLLTTDSLQRINSYGSLLFKINADGFEKMVQHNQTIIAVKDKSLYLIDKESVLAIPFQFGEKPIKELQLTQDFLYIYDGNILYTYTLNQP
jgi:hypothetical protein